MQVSEKLFSLIDPYQTVPNLKLLRVQAGYNILSPPVPLEVPNSANCFEVDYKTIGYAYELKSKVYAKNTGLRLIFVVSLSQPVHVITRALWMAFHRTCYHKRDCCGCQFEHVLQTKDLGNGFFIVRTLIGYNI